MSTLHLISHTHWDREWYLTFEQFRIKLVHLLDQLLEILKAQPDYKYFMLDGQTISLEDYLAIRPEREPELISLITDGRILIGPWYVSPDEFLVAPESLIRNLLEGKKLGEKYGGRMLIGYLPDSFGHISQMPQILQGFGIDAACLWRGLSDQPAELIWKAPDGSQVLLAYMRDSYSNAASLNPSNAAKFAKEIMHLSQSLVSHSPSGHLLLMNGTDHAEPSWELAKALNAYQLEPHEDTLIHSTLSAYFHELRSFADHCNEQSLEVIGELRESKHSPLLQNVLSTRIGIKQCNQFCEIGLLSWVEPFSAWAELLAQDHPILIKDQNDRKKQLHPTQPIIDYAWRLLMQCHAHDSICGTTIDQVAREMAIRFDRVEQINQTLALQSLEQVSDHVDTRFPSESMTIENEREMLSTIMVFNPNDGAVTNLVKLGYTLPVGFTSIEVLDSEGIVVDYAQNGIGQHDLINMVMDKKALRQALSMINEGNVAGMMITHLEIQRENDRVIIHVTLSLLGKVNRDEWQKSLAMVEVFLEDPTVAEFLIRASSDPEISLSFLAKEVPAHGYKTYWVRGVSGGNVSAPEPIKSRWWVKAFLPMMKQLSKLPLFSEFFKRQETQHTKALYKIENEYFTVEPNRADGSLVITDKWNHQTYTGQNRFIDGGDCGDVYNYCPPLRDQTFTAKPIRIECQISPLIQKMQVGYRLIIPRKLADDRKSRGSQKIGIEIESEITLVRGVPRIDINSQIDNQAGDHRIRVHFPAPFYTDTAWYDGHFGLVERPIGLPQHDDTWEELPRPEAPQREFTTITNGQLSLTVANRGLPEVEVLKNQSGNVEIALTLLRCVGWLSRDDINTRKGHAGPMGVETPDAQMPGKQSFAYAIIPAGEDWRNSIHLAREFNAPMKAMEVKIHPGTLSYACSMVENMSKDFMLTAIKLDESGAGLILRGYNTQSSPISVSCRLWKDFKVAQVVNLDETIIRDLPVSANKMINFELGAQKIVTFRFGD